MNMRLQFLIFFLIILAVGLASVSTDLAAGPLKVNSAEPNNGTQGDFPFPVEIKGQGFTNAKNVKFLVSKSTSTGGVGVGLLSVVDDETITVQVSIPLGATVGDYDIEVQLSNGRKGKGTTLFAVKRGGDQTAVVYTVELSGVFKFDAVPVSLNSKGQLNSVDPVPLMITRPLEPTPEQTIWDTVIANCARSLQGNPTIDFMLVDFDEWGLGRNGDEGILWINLESIRLPDNEIPEKEIQILLRRRFAPNPDFLPETPGDSITHDLDSYVVWGKPFSGKKRSWETCYKDDEPNDDGVNLLPASLTITRPPLP